MDTSIFLEKLVGPMMLAMGLFVAFNPQRIRRVGREFIDSEALMFMSGIIALAAGLAIVITHNVWEANWRTLITLTGWIAVFAGIARMFLPIGMKTLGDTMLEKTFMTAVPGALTAIVGGYLTYQGFLT